jgi:ATP-binding cassette subfamily B protein
MKLLLRYLTPYKWLVMLALLLAAINQSFSMLDPYFFGRLLDKYAMHPYDEGYFDIKKQFVKTGTRTQTAFIWGVLSFLGILISVAMVSRIAKAFQDYTVNVIVQKFGAKIFTDGLQHSMRLPYQEFEDQRSGETLSILTKVRSDTERFIGYFINVLFAYW